MRGQEFRARDKKVQKMTRDGLTEKNLTAGTEQRISGRLADVSFGREKAEDAAAGHRAKSRTQKTMCGDGAPVRDAGSAAEGRKRYGAARHSPIKETVKEERQDGEPAAPEETAARGETAMPDLPENRHIFEADRAEAADASKIRADRKKRMAAKFSADSEKAARLHYEKARYRRRNAPGRKPRKGKRLPGKRGRQSRAG